MKFLNINIFVILNFVTLVISSTSIAQCSANYSLPSDFSFGVATAAYQIEGGWDADGKGPSIWDTFTHEHSEKIADRSNGDIGPDSYHKFDLDLQALKELGVNFYRFSIGWARVLPTGDISSLNQAGVNYYNMVIDKLLQNDIKPMVTMYHYDLPAELQKIGGLANPLFVKYFEEYANVLYKNFGDRVKTWITFNEPYDYCIPGYGKADQPPIANASGIGEYLCIHHTVKAHAAAYKLYKEKYFDKFGGKIGLTFSSRFYYSKSNDKELVDKAMNFYLGWVAHPIYSKKGGYPDVVVDAVAKNSAEEGRAWSRLPDFGGEKELIAGTADFLGLNYYTARYVEKADPPLGDNPSLERDSGIKAYPDPTWKRAKSTWLYSVPQGLTDILRWIRDEYENVEVIITENGWSDNGEIEDIDRIVYMKEHLNAIAAAIEDGCNVAGYAAWSLIDNFEWLLGYTEKFGLYSVNYDSPNKERVAKKSAGVYKNIIKTKQISSV